MSDSTSEKLELEGAEVYIHLSGEASGPPITHIDIEHPALSNIINPSETTFAGGMEDGAYVALINQMTDRAESFVAEHDC